KIIQEIQNDTKSTIVIEEEDNKGIIQIFAPDYESITAAKNRIRLITAKPEVGEIYSGKVKSITDFGAFVEFLPGKDGLLHISEICWERLDDVKSVLNIGDTVDVKLIEIDPKTGKYRLSRKVLLPKPEGYVAPNKEHGNNENRRQGQGQDNRQDNRRFKPRSNNSNPQK
ncbi:MAG: S1 RNA-binding domain-containing protein, partial [Bacteroidales bacterium]|nr:S1 RNA-binding domain-containing protein [Bacteroidales bacterium]